MKTFTDVKNLQKKEQKQNLFIARVLRECPKPAWYRLLVERWGISWLDRFLDVQILRVPNATNRSRPGAVEVWMNGRLIGLTDGETVWTSWK